MCSKTLLNYETLVHATAGAAGSIVAMTVFYPLDNIKIRMQMGDPLISDCSTWEALVKIFKQEGVEALYKGMKPVLGTLGLSNFIYFYTFHGFKSLLPKNFTVTAQTDLLISITAGITNVLLTTPLWVVNSRLKIEDSPCFTGIFDGLIHIANTEGLSALWSGLAPSLALVSNPAINFTVYEAVKRKVTLKSATAFFLVGAFSKTIATVLTYPLQLAQTRQRLNSDNRKMGTAALMLNILKRNGFGALYQGMETKLLQTVLSAALMFMTYEKVAQFVFFLLLRNRRRLRKI